jgi:hypothetical protein
LIKSSRYRQQEEEVQQLRSEIATYRNEGEVDKHRKVEIKGLTRHPLKEPVHTSVEVPLKIDVAQKDRISLNQPIAPTPRQSTATLSTSVSPATPTSSCSTPLPEPPRDATTELGFNPYEISVMCDEHSDTHSIPFRGNPDGISASSAATGPSIQVIERMSAAIRRLESEKVATREELTRISVQRDDARAEIVSLMKENEIHKRAIAQIPEFKNEIAMINERYFTTLELLGEKSELVEELQADIQDMKAMYRELVERTTR